MEDSLDLQFHHCICISFAYYYCGVGTCLGPNSCGSADPWSLYCSRYYDFWSNRDIKCCLGSCLRLIGCGSGVMSGSTISTICWEYCPSTSTPGSSTFSFSPISCVSASSFSESTPTPGIYTSPMRQTCLYVKVNCLGWYPTNVLTLTITVSGMGIKFQLSLEILFAVFQAMNLYPPCRLPLRPRHIAYLVLKILLLLGFYSSCT